MNVLTILAKLALMGCSIGLASMAGATISKGCPCPDAAPMIIGALACGAIGSFLGREA